MSDLIDRQAVIDELEERIKANRYSNVALVSELNRCIGYIMRLPSAQPEIIRCKDCKHRPKEVEGSRYLEFPDDECICQSVAPWYEWMPEDDFYCANAERRE